MAAHMASKLNTPESLVDDPFWHQEFSSISGSADEKRRFRADAYPSMLHLAEPITAPDGRN